MLYFHIPTQQNGHFLLGDRTPYDNKHLHGWRGKEHRLTIHPVACLMALNGDYTSVRNNGETRPYTIEH